MRSRAFVGVVVSLFAASATLTVVRCASMAAMGGMPMPGGWRLSMTWIRMPGQTWPAVAVSFLAMWIVMMMAMMLPSLAAALWRYREALGPAAATRLGRLTTLAAAGYFFVWTVVGMAVFLFAVCLAEMAMRQPAVARAVPLANGAAVLLAGALQLTPWKARRLRCCRETPDTGLCADAAAAWRYGMRLGRDCSYCCCELTLTLLVIGLMDLRAMTVVTGAVNMERFAGARVSRAIGAVLMGVGVALISREAGVQFMRP